MHKSPFFGHSRRVRAAPRVHRRRRHPPPRLEGLVQDRPLYIKQYEAETNLRCTLVVDVSESMHYGRGPLNKYDYACTAAACLATCCCASRTRSA